MLIFPCQELSMYMYTVCHNTGIVIVSVEFLEVNFALVASSSTAVGSVSERWYCSLTDSCKSLCN